MALVSLQEVSVSFGGPLVLDRVTLHIESGQRVCLLGRNGEGKSSLMRIISAELTPDQGDVQHQQGLRIGHLPQNAPQEIQGTALEIAASFSSTSRTVGLPYRPYSSRSL